MSNRSSVIPPTEQAALCLRVQAGDRAALDSLMRSVSRLLWRTANRMTRRPELREDLFQVGALAVIRAAESFDPGRGVVFLSYAGKAMVRAMAVEVNRDVRQPGKLGEAVDDLAATSGETDIADVAALLRGLDDDQRQTVELYFGLDIGTPRSLEEAGRALGISKQAAGARVNRAIKTLRERFDAA